MFFTLCISLIFFYLIFIFSNKYIQAWFYRQFAGRRAVWTATSATDWSWYNELNVNTWQGFEVGDQQKVVLNRLDDHSLSGMFNPDTVMWAVFGRVTVHQAEIGITDRFHYNNYWVWN